MKTIFETLEPQTKTIKDFIANYKEMKQLIRMSKTMTKKEKTDTYNKQDESLQLMCNSYFNLVLNSLLKKKPFEIAVKDKDGVPVKHDFYSWFQHIPASTKYHDVENGGLVKHSQKFFYNWIKSLIQMDIDYPIEKAAIVALAHDFCKTTHYYYDWDDLQWHNIYPETTHHAKKSIEILKQIGIEITPDMEALILMHMSGYENEEDKQAVSLEAKNWLFNLDSIQILQLMNTADQQ